MNFGAYVPGQGLDAWRVRKERENLATSASSIVPSDTKREAQRELASLRRLDQDKLRNDGSIAAEEVRARTAAGAQDVAAQNNAAQQAAEQQRLGFQSRQAAADTALKQTQNQSAVQTLAAQKRLASATTPDERATAEDTLRALQGKYEKPQRVSVLRGGVNSDGTREPDYAVNNSTGEVIQPKAVAKPAYAEGTRSVVNGKTAIWTNGRWVPQ